MFSGVVRQQPPIIVAPQSIHSLAIEPYVLPSLLPCHVFVTASYISPLLGYTTTGFVPPAFASFIRLGTNSGAVQFMPTASTQS